MIPGILEVSSKTIYGLTSKNVPIYRFRPLNKNRSDHLVGCSLKDRSKNMLALVEKSDTRRTNLIRLIGPCGDLQSEKEALLFQYASTTWKKFDATTLTPPNMSTRTLVNGYTFNIDPPGCKDIDDTITIGYDGFIYITIADVASWMVTNPDLFKKASLIGQTVYDDGKIVSSLLPIEDQCSLLPNTPRAGVSMRFKWTGTQITDVSFEEVTLVNNESLTYENAQTFKYAGLLSEIASYLAGKDVTDSHDWIEQFMIFYNCEVATRLVTKGNGILRSQDSADIEKLNDYMRIGIDELFLANKSAKYIPASAPQKHWGLNKDYYCHATSPIRRFADIVNQMVLCGYDVSFVEYDQLNDLQTQAKKYERETFFLQTILSTSSRVVNGISLNDHRVWVPEWKRIVTCKNDAVPGTKRTLKYSLDMNQLSWKRRMVFKFVDTDCPEQQSS